MWVVRGCPLSSHTRNQISSILFFHHHNLWQVERENERKNLAFNCLGLEMKHVASSLTSLACTNCMAPNWIPGRLGRIFWRIFCEYEWHLQTNIFSSKNVGFQKRLKEPLIKNSAFHLQPSQRYACINSLTTGSEQCENIQIMVIHSSSPYLFFSFGKSRQNINTSWFLVTSPIFPGGWKIRNFCSYSLLSHL